MDTHRGRDRPVGRRKVFASMLACPPGGAVPMTEPRLPTVRYRSPAHLSWVRSLGCGIQGCHERPIHAHHNRSAATAGTGVKPGDANVINLCWRHHAEGHQTGWKTFEKKYSVDLQEHATFLACHSPDQRIKNLGLSMVSAKH